MSRWDNVNVLTANNDGDNTETKIEEMEQDKFKMKNYIPQRYHPKYRKYALIIAGVLTAVIIVILIAVLCSKSSSDSKIGNNNDELTNFRSKLVLLTNDTKLVKFDPQTNNSTLMFETNKIVSSFDVLTDARVYWTEMYNGTSTRLRVLANGNLSTLINDPRFEPHAMTLDHITENLYVLDEAAGNLVVVNVRSGDYTLLMSELMKPHEIVLDAEDGLMFLLQLSDSILRARMDGNEVTKLVSNSGTTSLTIDPKRKRLYWINDFVNIESSDYDGKHRRSFFNDSVTMSNLAILDDRIYWLWPGYSTHASSLLSCKINANDSCDDYTSYTMTTMSLGSPKYMKAYSASNSIIVKNPCERDNGGCQQLCLLSSRNMRSCACRMGWQLSPDKRNCREVRDFVLYPQAGFVHTKSIYNEVATTTMTTRDLFWPTPYKIASTASKGEIDFDYDLANDEFYWSDDFHIWRMKLRNYEGNQTRLLSVNATSMLIEDIAYDWYTGNMYYVQRSKTSMKQHSLILFNVRLGEAYQRILYSYKYDMSFGLQACPYAIVLHPAEHSIFFTAGENERRIIQHADMDATVTSLHKIYNTFPAFVHEYRLIAVDYAQDRLYWIWDSDRVSVVKHARFDGTDMRLISIDEVKDAKTIYVYQRWLYVSNLTGIWRMHKETGESVTRIDADNSKTKDNVDKRHIAGVRVISQSIQFNDPRKNGCAVDNEHHHCEQFCLNTRNGVSCLCQYGENHRNGHCF